MANEANVEVSEVKAVAKYIRVSPQKARSVANEVRGKDLREALGILKFANRKAADIIIKVVESAAANAENNNNMNKEDLYIKSILIDEGPTMKRFRARAQGRADQIRKRTSHVTVVVGTKEV